MKIAWVMTDFDPSNPIKHKYGVGWFIVENLKKLGHDVTVIGGFSEPYFFYFKIKQLLNRLFSSKKYLRHREPGIYNYFAKMTEKELAKEKYDFVFSFGSLPVSCLKTDIPIFFWTDATFDGLVDYYPEYTGLSEATLQKGRMLEQAALDNARAAFFTSEWALNTALKYYNTTKDKLYFVPFGANISEPEKDEVLSIIENKSLDRINFLFNGRDWERKNGNQAVELVKILNAKGVKSKLNIIGINKIDSINDNNIIFHGFIDKNSPEGMKKMTKIFKDSHFLLHIPLQDCTPHALNEANAYGLPCIVSNTGGISSIIKHDVNGMLYDLPLNLELIANDIINIVKDSDKYVKFAKSSFNEYTQTLNWRVNVKKVIRIIEEKLNE